VIPQIKVLYNRLPRNGSSKAIDVLKLNGTLQNVSYRHVIIVTNYNTNDIHISYQSAVSRGQDKSFFFLHRICENFRKISRMSYSPQTSQLVASLAVIV
jgi:hypothetical protein